MALCRILPVSLKMNGRASNYKDRGMGMNKTFDQDV
jgi:hypothetical protein